MVGNGVASRPTRILYLFPDRSSASARRWEQEEFWPVYREAADAVGLDFDVADPEHVVLTDGEARWNGDALDPARDVIVYDVRADPVRLPDLWVGVTLVRSLEALGFWSAIPLDLAILCSDKFATTAALQGAPVPTIPSVRVPTGRDTAQASYQELVPDEWFPAFVKPASWGRGLGCVICPDRGALDAVLGLASGSGAAMVIQPYVGEVIADIRLVLVDGVVLAAYDRVPDGGSHVANISRGGSARLRNGSDGALSDLAAHIGRKIDVAYLCVDVLQTRSGALWVSELELDGAVSALFDDPDLVRHVVGSRFRAYAARLEERYRVPHGPGARSLPIARTVGAS